MYLLSWEQYVYICKLYQTLKDCDYVIDSMGLNWCKVIVQVYCLTWSARDWRSENTIYGDHSINCLCRWKGRDRETSDVSLAPLPEKGVSGRSLVTPSSPRKGKGAREGRRIRSILNFIPRRITLTRPTILTVMEQEGEREFYSVCTYLQHTWWSTLPAHCVEVPR